MRQLCTKGRRAGFTLIELLAVIAILAILMTVLLVNLGGAEDTVMVSNARNKLKDIELAIALYESKHGDWPASHFDTSHGTPQNTQNMGSECLYLALCAEGADSFGQFDDDEDLGNMDADALSKAPKGFQVKYLFELADPWGNPIAYFHNRDYEREDSYITIDGELGEEVDNQVRAQRSTKTGRWYNPQEYQLMSAGPDGLFGTEDDVTNF